MKCSKCGTEMTALDSYRCPSCGRMTCLQHRMPDRHDCYESDSKGLGVRSLLTDETQKPAEAPKAASQTQQPSQPAPQKKKRFGFF